MSTALLVSPLPLDLVNDTYRNVMINVPRLRQGSFKSLLAMGLDPEIGMERMRTTDWGALVNASIDKWILAYPETAEFLTTARPHLTKKYSDVELENFLCEEWRNRVTLRQAASWRVLQDSGVSSL